MTKCLYCCGTENKSGDKTVVEDDDVVGERLRGVRNKFSHIVTNMRMREALSKKHME